MSYYSCSLSRPELNYCITRWELLAVVRALRDSSPYLYGQLFMLGTDHASWTWLLSLGEPEGQLVCWLEVLQGIDFEDRHRVGRLHRKADSLS